MTTFAGPPVFPQYFVDPLGKPLRSVKITVYERGTETKPDLYADREKSTPLGNPFWATSLGNAEFRVDAVGEFEAEVNGVRIPFTVVADPEEPVTIGAGVIEEAMLQFGVATQAELDALSDAAAAGDAGLASAVEAVETALAGKATPAQIDAAIAALSGTFVQTADYELGGPSTPELVGSLTGGNLSAPRGLWINEAEGFAYVACSGKFTVVDISDPASPVEVGSCAEADALFGSREVQVSGHTAFVSADNEGGVGSLVVIDVSDPFAPTITAKVTSANMDSAHGLELAGDRTYMACSTANKLVIHDVSVRTRTPPEVAAVTMPQPSRVIVQGRKVYCSNSLAAADPNGGGLNILDLDTMVVTTIRSALLNGARGMVKRGRYVFLACTPLDKIAVVDLLTGTHVTAADFTLEDGPREMRSVGDLLVVTLANTAAMAVIDASDPLNMVLVGEIASTVLTDSNGLRLVGRNADGLAFATGSDPSPAGLGIFRIPWPRQGNGVAKYATVESNHMGADSVVAALSVSAPMVRSVDTLQHDGSLVGFNGRTPRLGYFEPAAAPTLGQWAKAMRDFLLSRGDTVYAGEALGGLGAVGSGVVTPYTADMDLGASTWSLRVKVRHDTWANPAAIAHILSRATDDGVTSAYEVRISTAGNLQVVGRPLGGGVEVIRQWVGFTATCTPGVARDLGMVIDADAGKRRVRFYDTTDDGETWNLLETDSTAGAVASAPQTGAADLHLGARRSTHVGPWDGEILLAEVRNGDLTTEPVVTFDPTTVQAEGPSPFTTDGREWTLAGAATILGPTATVDDFSDTGALPVIIDRTPTDLDIANTVAETTLYAVTIPAGALETARTARLEVRGDVLNNSGGSINEQVRVKFGGVTLFDGLTGAITTAGTRKGFQMVLTLSNRNAANAQVGHLAVTIGGSGPPATGQTGFSNAAALVGLAELAVGAIDTATAQLLEITVQHPSAASTISLRRQNALATIL